MNKSVLIIVFLFIFLILSISTQAQWTNVTSGIDYQQFNLTLADGSSIRAFVARMDRNDTTAFIESSIANGYFYNSPEERPSQMASRYDGAINWWGQKWGNRNKVIVAINGDFWEREYSGGPYTGFPSSGQIHSGWFARRFIEYAGTSGFVWNVNRGCFLGGNLRNGQAGPVDQWVIFDSSTADITHVNVSVGRSTTPNALILYSSQYYPHTNTDNDRVEVLVQMNRPTLMFHESVPLSLAEGTVKQILHSGSTYIPFDHVVLSAHGNLSTTLINNCYVGQKIGLKLNFQDYGTTGQVTTNSSDWTKAYASIGGGPYVVKNGIVPVNDWSNDSTRHPRTCIAFNSTYIYFVVIDGRSPQSVGVSYKELGDFCVNQLGALWAVNEDGGGSSVLVVNGQIKNVPSDGSERATNNGMLMCLWEPAPINSTFTTGQQVKTPTGGQIRQGPGTNYPTLTNATTNQSGTILGHVLNGVNAKGQNWWYWQSGNFTGWTSDSQLADILEVGDWSDFNKIE